MTTRHHNVRLCSLLEPSQIEFINADLIPFRTSLNVVSPLLKLPREILDQILICLLGDCVVHVTGSLGGIKPKPTVYSRMYHATRQLKYRPKSDAASGKVEALTCRRECTTGGCTRYLSKSLTVLRTCKHLHEAAESILYRKNTFFFTYCQDPLENFALILNPSQKAWLRSIYLQEDIHSSEVHAGALKPHGPTVDCLRIAPRFLRDTDSSVCSLTAFTGLRVLSIELVFELASWIIPSVPFTDTLGVLRDLELRELHLWLTEARCPWEKPTFTINQVERLEEQMKAIFLGTEARSGTQSPQNPARDA